MIKKSDIPEKFYKGSMEKPVAYTAAALIRLLSELPPELHIAQGFDDGVQITVYNVSTNPVIEFEEVDDD